MTDKPKTQVTLEEKNGRTYSRRKEYHENGILAKEGLYASGNQWAWDVPAGKVTTWFKSGNVSSVEEFDEHGNRDGESAYYNDKGQLTLKRLYAKDKILREIHFKDGKEIAS